MKALVFLNKKNDYSKKIVLFLRKKKFKIKIIWSGENYENLSKKIGSWKGDFIFHLSSYYKILQKTLNKAKKLSINFHTALPKYPGRGGYSWALFNEDKYYGITVQKINNKIDNGKIIYVSKFIISNSESLDSLIQKTKFFQFVTFKKIINEYVIPKYIYNKNEILKKSNNKWSKKYIKSQC